MSALDIETARVFLPLLEPARYKGAWGGRGSGKSHFFAETLIDEHICNPGLRSVCIREVQKSLKESAKRLIEDKIRALKVEHLFDCQKEMISAPGGGVIIFQGMQDHTAESIKSLEGFGRAWVEEAQTLSANSLKLLRPTIREPGSELWFSWNPRRKSDPVDMMFRGGSKPTGAIVVKANWDRNPWFPAELEQERQDCLRDEPDEYDHIWEGGYVTVSSGAYFAKQLREARSQGRIGAINPDPLMEYRTFWDLGVSDHTAIWVAQFVGSQIRMIDYCEGQGQPLGFYVSWLRDSGYRYASCVLPHDAAKRDGFTAVKFEDHLREAGFEVRTVPNQGKGAAMQRIEVARRLFPNIHFNEAKCSAGLEALGSYHERKDDKREIGLGPEHDWASHGADAFGLMCVAYQHPYLTTEEDWADDRENGRNQSTGY